MVVKTQFDSKGRWRSRTVAFRVSDEEAEEISAMARVCGMNKQDYCTLRLLQRDIVVIASPRTYINLKNELIRINEELTRITSADKISDELIRLLETITEIIIKLSEVKDDQ